MIKKLSLVLLLAFALGLFSPQLLYSAKKMAPKTSVKGAKTSAGITVSYKLRKDKRVLTITFGSLQNAKSVDFTLLYNGSGNDQGVMGEFTVKKGMKTKTQQITLGTCSSGTCVYYTRVKNMKLEVTAKLKNGKTFSKIYSIKT